MRARSLVLALVAMLALATCKRRFPSEGLVLGGQRVPYATLRNGWNVYGTYCRSCHGDNGDGRGPMGIGMQPAPRDFRRGIVKFASVPSGQLPTDADLARTVRSGLHGTPMHGWDLPDEDVVAVVQYLKTLSPRWRDGRAGTPITVPPDPWLAREHDARERGAHVYHAVAQCWTCHPAYASRATMREYVFEAQGVRIEDADIRPDVEFAVMQTTDWGTRVMPPDFPHVAMKAGNSLADLYRTIAAGVGGTSMPAWQGVLPDEDLWALVHYVRGLARAE